MAHVKQLFDKNFLEYASYVIKDRAIPDISDGLKPVQRRILYTLYLIDDGTTHKVANVVGRTMALHPHGDASIYEALVNLANKELFIEKQGNFGNIATGDPAAASRYIECAILPFAKSLLFKDEITTFVDSYDGKMVEPVNLPVKIPLVLMLGAEGIAVGMSTRILPHNFIECLEAVLAKLKGEDYTLYPDFPLGGLVDCSQYNDGLGKVICRAKLDTSDSKRIIIRELPFGVTVENMIESIEEATKRGRIKVGAIHDFTAENVEIAIDLQRGVHSDEVEEALYAFTNCEVSISVNCLVIKDRKPVVMPIKDVIAYHANHLVSLLEQELNIEVAELKDKIRVRTLERIFIEERIYKQIEEKKTALDVEHAVKDGFKPFEKEEFVGSLSKEDIDTLLRIPIRRISLFDISKNQKELSIMLKRISEIEKILKNLVAYACSYLGTLIKDHSKQFARKTEITNFKRLDVREVAIRNLKIKFDKDKGYVGFGVNAGELICDANNFDRLLIIKKDGTYQVVNLEEKMFIGKDILHICLADKKEMEEKVYNVLYLNHDNNCGYIKRFKINQFITGKVYPTFFPDRCTLLDFCLGDAASITLKYAETRLIKDKPIDVRNYLIKGVSASGVRLSPYTVKNAKFK